MKDLDFDELDKAVSSLMSDKKDAPAPLAENSSFTPPSINESSSVTVTNRSSSPALTQPAARVTPPAARRSGRFMDVVPATRKETAPVSRQGKTFQPDVVPTTAEAPTSSVVSEVEKPTLTTDWPDPLELATSKTGSDIETSSALEIPTPSKASSTEVKSEENKTEPVATLVDEPLSSPFLPDTKVEKRPLGTAAPVSFGSELLVEDENAQLPALPKDVEPVLPEELHGDVVSIEADNSTTNPSMHKADSQGNEYKAEAPMARNEPKVKEPEVTITQAAVSVGPTSIPQQYKEEPDSGEQKNGSIYDTDSYHQPLSHPVKKKSGWSWVLWILVILVVGAGGGAALFFLGIV